MQSVPGESPLPGYNNLLLYYHMASKTEHSPFLRAQTSLVKAPSSGPNYFSKASQVNT